MTGDILFLVTAVLFLSVGIYAFVVFSRWRTKRNLATLVLMIALLISTVFLYFKPNDLKFVGGLKAQILFFTIVAILVELFLFYPEIKQFLDKRKNKTH